LPARLAILVVDEKLTSAGLRAVGIRGNGMDIHVVILGDGTGGIVTANLLRKKVERRNLLLKLTLVGNSPTHIYQPGLLFIPFRKPGYRSMADIQKPAADFIAPDIEYVCEKILAIDPVKRQVTTESQTLS